MAKIKYEVGDFVEIHDDYDLCGDLAANQGTIVEIGNEGYLGFRVEEPWGNTKAGELYWIKDSWIYNFVGTPKPIPRVAVELTEDELASQLYGVDNTGGLENEEPINVKDHV